MSSIQIVIYNSALSITRPLQLCTVMRNLSANSDKLQFMLSELSFPFQLIGLTETKLKPDQIPLTNIDIEGYNFISQPSLSNAGGSGIYVQNNLNFTLRSDFLFRLVNLKPFGLKCKIKAIQISFVELFIDILMVILTISSNT